MSALTHIFALLLVVWLAGTASIGPDFHNPVNSRNRAPRSVRSDDNAEPGHEGELHHVDASSVRQSAAKFLTVRPGKRYNGQYAVATIPVETVAPAGFALLDVTGTVARRSNPSYSRSNPRAPPSAQFITHS